MKILISIVELIKQGKIHIPRFAYLISGSILQIGSLNFIVYPYLSRQMTDQRFGEVLLLMTVINFYATALGAPLVMSYYRKFSDIPPDRRPQFTGSAVKILILGTIIIGLMSLAGYDLIVYYWKLSLEKKNYNYLLCYLLFYVMDTFLLSRIQLDYNFKVGFYSRILYFLSCLLIIPAYTYFPDYWMLSFMIAPAISCATLYVLLLKKGEIELVRSKSDQYAASLAKDYFPFLITCLSSQLLVFSDRWLIALFDVSKAEIAYFTIAVQACSLILFPVEKFSELIMPFIVRLNSLAEMNKIQARKLLFALIGSMLYVSIAGLWIGYLFFKLYKPTYFEYGWRYFIVLLFGTALYPIYTFSRVYFIKYYPTWYLTNLQVLALGIQLLFITFLLSIYHNAIFAAIGKSLGFSSLALASFLICQTRLIKIAFQKTIT